MNANDEAVVFGSEFPDYLTPFDFAAALRREFHIGVDLAADRRATIARRWLGPGSDLGEDALKVEWSELWVDADTGNSEYLDTGFLNPPWSRKLKMPIEPWLRKAITEAGKGFTTVMVVPNRPDTRWWRLSQHAQEIREIPHRVKFLLPVDAFDARNRLRLANGKKALKGRLVTDGGREAIETSGAGFPTAVLIFRPQPGVIGPALPRRVVWDYLNRTKRAG